MAWLQIKFKIYQQVEGATCQCQTAACDVVIYNTKNKLSTRNFFFQGQNLNGLAANQDQNLSTSRGRHLSVLDWSL